jgi:hypothetical protein
MIFVLDYDCPLSMHAYALPFNQSPSICTDFITTGLQFYKQILDHQEGADFAKTFPLHQLQDPEWLGVGIY